MPTTKALQILANGGIVAYPTETIYGLGADALNETAIRRIFVSKGRSFQSPISVIIHSREQLLSLVRNIPDYAQRLMDAFWPGALTIIFPALPCISQLLTAGTGKIGVRISSHPIAHSLAIALGKPITATSANIAGMPECHTAPEVLQQLGNKIDLIIDGGKSPLGVASTIVDVNGKTPVIIREGTIKSADVFGLIAS